ncbi:restriction endonuclease [Xanthomonas fragariae]|uniref:restriction endonuclease n=1 Tax=Xanthomonas fragariae TaxID=48664 RepID=UPI0022AAD9E8|nr:restriction endonuclease [Xanthomonas fragariae]WAT14980.1 restriction endonuclease [Xanthomonas fragariae]
MGRRKKQGGFKALAALPWPVGFIMGIAAYLALRYGIGWWLSHQGGMLSQGFAQQADGMFAPLAWMLLGICWLVALCSYLGTRSRRRFLETRTSLESLAAGGWRQFEQLVGEAFRRQGYSVEHTGLGGADGGIDLILRKPIELIGGEQLLGMIRAVQEQATAQPAPARVEPVFAPPASTAAVAPSYPRCGSALVRRRNRRTNEDFDKKLHRRGN